MDFEFKASPYLVSSDQLVNSGVAFLDLGQVRSFVWGWNGILAGYRTRARGHRILLERFALHATKPDTPEPHRTYI